MSVSVQEKNHQTVTDRKLLSKLALPDKGKQPGTCCRGQSVQLSSMPRVYSQNTRIHPGFNMIAVTEVHNAHCPEWLAEMETLRFMSQSDSVNLHLISLRQEASHGVWESRVLQSEGQV